MFLFTANVWFTVLIYSVTRGEISIDSDGGYKEVVVAISPDASKERIENLISELEVLFRNASSTLHRATREQTYFKEIIFVVPKKYQSALSVRNWIADRNYFKSPEIIVTSEDAFNYPYALQHKGCGLQGLRIHIPEDFLVEISKEHQGKALVQEWAKYRYGIFDESGFVGDELYPACYTVPGSDVVRVVDCTDAQAEYDISKPSRQFPGACNPIPVKGRNAHIVSSFMNKLSFQKAYEFCDDEMYPHNKNVPSKHNTLCRGQSTWKVISRHQDFRFKRTKQSKLITNKTIFKYALQPDIRLILAIDTSDLMAQNARLDMVRNAFSYFTLYSLPENSLVGLINMKAKNGNPLLVTVHTPADAEILIDAFPEAYRGEGTCVQCAIEQAIQTLKTNTQKSHGDILIISATDIELHYIKSLESQLKQSDLTLHVLFLGKRLKTVPLLERLASASRGRFYYIPDDVGNCDSLSTLTLLHEAFRSLYESFSWMNKNHVLVEQKSFPPESCTTCNLSFVVDDSMNNFQVLITGPNFVIGPPIIKDKTILSNGNQEFAPGHSSFSYKIKIPAFIFSIKKPKSVSWNLSFQRKPDFQTPLVVMVRSFSQRHNGMAHMHSWLTHSENSKEQPPIAMYSEIKVQQLPVSNVSVSAILCKPETGEEISLNLLDVGDGDPDITKNDGIFSKYLTEASESGYYFLTTVAETKISTNNIGGIKLGMRADFCCGGSYPPNVTYGMGVMKRVVIVGSFYLSPENVGLQFPPRRISDLRVSAVITLQRSLRVAYNLNWTSPGNNYDSGMVAGYQLRVFLDKVAAEEHFDTGFVSVVDDFNIHGEMLTRYNSTAGSPQGAIVELRNLTSGYYYFAMRTMNDAGITSDISNVVEIWYDQPILASTGYPYTAGDGTTTSMSSTGSYPDDQPITMASGLGLALGITFGILVFLILIGCILYYYFARLRSEKEEKQHNKPAALIMDRTFLSGNSQKSESQDVLCQNPNPANVSAISPVNSWPANSLINYYETLKRERVHDGNEDYIGLPKDASDTTSMSSGKHSYMNNVDQNSSLYDPVYFNQEDQINFPYNPSYVPFNPMYTSSLRHLHEKNRTENLYSSNCSTLNASALNEQGLLNPSYTLSLPRSQEGSRTYPDYSPNTTNIRYIPDEQRTPRLGTDV